VCLRFLNPNSQINTLAAHHSATKIGKKKTSDFGSGVRYTFKLFITSSIRSQQQNQFAASEEAVAL
jgi:hypothetical protein